MLTFPSPNDTNFLKWILEQVVWGKICPHFGYSKKATLKRRLQLCKICDASKKGCLQNCLVQNHGDFKWTYMNYKQESK
jgi:hypothetical protein